MGGVDLSDQLLNYYSFLWKSTKWSRKLLIHQLNLLILNAYILNKNYGCEKLTHDEYRDRIVKYLLGEGLKNYKIPLPPVLSKKFGKHNAGENDKTHLCERHFPSAIPRGEGRKRERPSRCCFICSYIPGHFFQTEKNILFGVKNVENCVLSLASKFTTQKGISKNMDNYLETG